VLIPVKYLVNGGTIRVERSATTTRYFHVELDEHDVLFAEGLPAESLVPGGDGPSFDNGGGPVSLFPDFHRPDFHSLAWEAEGCAQLIVTGPLLDRARSQLAERAAMLGQSPERLSA
jgi:hypothetical protein